MKKTSWLHPIHARGIRSPSFSVRGGRLLSNKKIDSYARDGFYGTEMQQAALSNAKPHQKVSQKRKLKNLLEKLLKGTTK